MRKILVPVASLTLAFALTLGVLEGMLRVYNANGENYDVEMWKYSTQLKRKSSNPLIGIEHIPSRSARLQNVSFNINSMGFRDREYAVPKPRGVYRIIVLGSSITLGWGVPNERTFVKLVEKRLERIADGKKVEIINTSVGNYNTARAVEAFLEKASGLEPDMVLLTFFINDPQVIEIKENPVLIHSQLAVLLWSRYQQVVRAVGLKEDFSVYYKNLYSGKNPGWSVCLEELQKLADNCRAGGVEVLFAMIPDIHNLRDYPFQFAHQLMKETALGYGWFFLDFYDVLQKEDAASLWAMRGDPHPNVRGHEIMADYLFAYLEKNRPWERSKSRRARS